MLILCEHFYKMVYKLGFVKIYKFMEIDWNIHTAYLIIATGDWKKGYYV